MRILVTGGAGFIGSHFVKHLLRYEDMNVVNFDKLTYAGNLNNLKEVENKKNYTFVHGDIIDKTAGHFVKDSDIIVNFAAETHVDRSISEPEAFVKTDVLGTMNLLEAVRKHDKEFIQISTDEIYGDIQWGSSNEGSVLNPRNPYSASKAGADLLVNAYYNTYSLKTKITRSSNNFGPNQYPEKFIPLFIINALQDKKLPMYGDGRNIRDWIYVRDNCSAIDLVIRKGKFGETYNISAQNEMRNIEVAKMILKELKKPEDLIEFVADRLGHDRRYSMNNKKLTSLGWKPKYKFEDALKETIKWYVENEVWWRPLFK